MCQPISCRSGYRVLTCGLFCQNWYFWLELRKSFKGKRELILNLSIKYFNYFHHLPRFTFLTCLQYACSELTSTSIEWISFMWTFKFDVVVNIRPHFRDGHLNRFSIFECFMDMCFVRLFFKVNSEGQCSQQNRSVIFAINFANSLCGALSVFRSLRKNVQ